MKLLKILKNIKNLSINIKVSFVFIMLITFLLLFSNITIYFLFSNVLRKQIIQDLDNVMTQSGFNMDTIINSINQASLYLCTDKSVAMTLSTEYKNKIDIPNAINNLRVEYDNHTAIPLNDVLSYYCSTFFVDESIPISKYLMPDYSLKYNGICSYSEVSSEGWYKKAYNLNGTSYTFILNGDKQRMYMARSVSRPYLINKKFKGGFMGVNMFSFDISQIGEKIETEKLTSSTIVFLTDSDGTIFYSNNNDDLQTSISRYMPLSLMKKYAGNTTESLDYKGQKYIVSTNALKYNWYLVALIPDKDISSRMTSTRNFICFTLLLALALGVTFSIVFSKSITQPIKKLAFTMKSVKGKDYLGISINPPSGDEVGTLYESFNSMMERINSLVNEVLRSSKLQRDAELKALQAQINPHFLYNTLDAINWLALCDGNEKIAAMTSSLAGIMRFNIKDPENPVTIAEELENVKNYVSIQFLRCADSFDIEYQIEPEIMMEKLPKLTLQPLVENSIVHGIESGNENGHIVIKGFVSGYRIIIRISDNGSGANAVELNSYLDDQKALLKKSDSVGIKNVNQRIKMNFGEAYGLSYENNEPRGISAVVVLPYNKGK